MSCCGNKKRAQFEAVLASGEKKIVASVAEARTWATAQGSTLEKVTPK